MLPQGAHTKGSGINLSRMENVDCLGKPTEFTSGRVSVNIIILRKLYFSSGILRVQYGTEKWQDG